MRILQCRPGCITDLQIVTIQSLVGSLQLEDVGDIPKHFWSIPDKVCLCPSELSETGWSARLGLSISSRPLDDLDILYQRAAHLEGHFHTELVDDVP